MTLVVGLLYTLPNFYGEAPAVQVSSGKATVKIDATMATRVEGILAQAAIKPDFVQFDGNSVKARFGDTDTQIKAKDAIAKALNPDPADPSWIVALNLLSRSQAWLTSIHALPMYLGLDLRGGGSKFHPGVNVKKGNDDTLFAIADGVVKFEVKRGNRKFVSVYAS